MKPEDRMKLDLNLQMLKDDLHIDSVVEYCYSKSLLTDIDRRRIEAERSEPDKVVRFIKILKTKNDTAFTQFLDALSSEHVDKAFIRKQLEETNVPAELTSDTGSEQLLEDVVRDSFIVDKGAKCSKEDVLKLIRMAMCYKHKKPLALKADKVYEVITRVFPESKIRKCKKIVVAFEHISARLQEGPPIQESASGGAGGHCEILEPTPLEKISQEKVAEMLVPHLKRRNLDVSLADKMIEQGVDGQALCDLQGSLELVKDIFPELDVGSLAKVRGAMTDTLKELQAVQDTASKAQLPQLSYGPAQRKLERYRDFDTPARATDVYVQGFVLDEEQSRPQDLTEPIHRYRIVEDDDTDKLAEETVRFAAAFLNEKRNGTIHFGVESKFDSNPNPGMIAGTNINKHEAKAAVSEALYRAFCDDQRELAMMCIKEPQFIPVIQDDHMKGKELYVVEIDVVPQYQLIRNEAFFLRPSAGDKEQLYRYVEGMVVSVEGKDLAAFMDTNNKLTALRRTNEKKRRGLPPDSGDLHRKLHMFLTGGTDYNANDVYPILFLSHCAGDMAGEALVDNFRFIKGLDPLAVFDFDYSKRDATGQPRGLCAALESRFGQVHKTLTTDNFDKNSEENKSSEYGDGISRMHEDIINSSSRAWIFCNGYDPLCEEMKPAEWRRKRGQGFREAVHFYKSKIPRDRAKILIFLLSRNYDVLFGALEEIFVKFPEQWMIIAASEETANEMVSEILRRKYVEKEEVEERCIIGMPWSHVNHSIMNICGHSSFTECLLPSSTGTPVLLKERKKNEWTDLELLSIKQCYDEAEELERKERQDELEDKDRQTEEGFYRGNQVTWWNFYFKTHVLDRQQTRELKKKVSDLLDGTVVEEDKVGLVSLLHQPGAGGTTVARHVLWELKDQFRCCEVRQITDQTCEQISNLRSFEEQFSARPVLVLIDNADFERVCQLRSQLTERARREARDGKIIPKIVCVLIVCRRMTTSKKRGKILNPDRTTVMLDHELKQDELEWFRKKYKELEAKYDESSPWRHPKLLISFNILKENFNADYIKSTVREFIADIDEKEKRLLRFIALINTFDLEFQTIPMSAFNPIMCTPADLKGQKPSVGRKQFLRGTTHWEASLSKSLNVLLNRSSKQCLGKGVQAVRIINSSLSKAILRDLREHDPRGRLKISEIILELLHSDICKKSSESAMQEQLIKIIKSILKTRAVTDKGREKFSPIILAIGEEEGYNAAAHVLETGFDVFYDPMIAQQAARVHLHMQNWKEAEKLAKEALDIEPGNSYLCDTYGQVYKQQLVVLWNESVQRKEHFEGQKAKEAVDIAFTAIDIFREEQKLTDSDVNSDYSNCGFFSELRVIAALLDILRFLQPFGSDRRQTNLHKFLVNRSYVPPELEACLGKDNLEKLKNLYHEYETPLRRLEDELVQLKEDPCYQDSPSYSSTLENYRTVVKLKVKLLVYFGEDNDEPPTGMNPEEANEYRRRRVKQRGGISLHSILELKDEPEGAQTLESMYSLIMKNVDSGSATADDLKILLNTIVALITLDKSTPHRLSMEQILQWTMELYEMAITQSSIYLEIFLYFVMFHWPTAWRKQQQLCLCPCSKIKDAIERWKQAFLARHPAQGERKRPDNRKPMTLFFLGQGEGLSEIAFWNEFRHFPGERIWETDEVKRRLKQLNGTLSYGGKYVHVSISSSDGSTTLLSIPTSFPIHNHVLWKTNVHFYLGFCWSGPKAYAVSPFTAEERSSSSTVNQTQDILSPSMESPPRELSPRSSYEKMMSEEAKFWLDLASMENQLVEVERKIRTCTNRKQGKDLEKKKQALERALGDLIEKRKSVLQGAD